MQHKSSKIDEMGAVKVAGWKVARRLLLLLADVALVNLRDLLYTVVELSKVQNHLLVKSYFLPMSFIFIFLVNDMGFYFRR